MPFEPSEVILLLVGAFALTFLFINRETLLPIPHFRLLMLSFLAQLCSWIATNLEALFWPTFFNGVEHFFDALTAIFLLLWCVRACIRREAAP